MGKLTSSPKAPPPPPPPAPVTPMPVEDTQATATARRRKAQELSQRSGRESTILSDTSDKLGS